VLATIKFECKVQVRVLNKVVLSAFFVTTIAFGYSPLHTGCTNGYKLRTVVVTSW